MDLEAAMRRADQLSRLGLGLTAPNPIVGAAVIDAAGELVGEGFHQRGDGGAHAEVNALAAAGNRARGATLVVTLEPCSHQGKTPPCVTAIIEAGITRVFYAVSDPNPIASGGAAQLMAAGIAVESGLLEAQVRFTNRAWLTKIQSNRPLITLKIAATLDGRIAAQDGTSKWLTSEAARSDVAVLRSECDAIVTGTGTYKADKPQLTVRGVTRTGVTAAFEPARIVIGLSDISAPEMIQLRTHDLNELIELSRKSGWNRILVEAGPTLISVLLRSGLFDEIFLYQAPTILGAGATFASDLGINTLAERLDLDLIASEIIEGTPNNLRTHLVARRS